MMVVYFMWLYASVTLSLPSIHSLWEIMESLLYSITATKMNFHLTSYFAMADVEGDGEMQWNFFSNFWHLEINEAWKVGLMKLVHFNRHLCTNDSKPKVVRVVFDGSYRWSENIGGRGVWLRCETSYDFIEAHRAREEAKPKLVYVGIYGRHWHCN
ncbi:hypothetical protein OROGR_018563 [Orobanche gracilis]